MWKKQVVMISVVVSLLMLTGCGGGSITFSIRPNPIVFTEDQLSQDMTFRFTTRGFGRLSLDEAIIEVFNDDGDLEYEVTEDISESIGFVVPGISQSYPTSIDIRDVHEDLGLLLNYAELRGREYTLVVTITGSRSITREAVIRFD